jgi:hypothetical protein
MTAGDLTGSSGNGQGAVNSQEEDVAAVRAGIEQTRAGMSETIDAIEEKPSPSHITEQAKETIKQTAGGRANETLHSVGETYSEKVGTVSRQARVNPVPLVAAGLSLVAILAVAYVIKRRRERARQTWQARYRAAATGALEAGRRKGVDILAQTQQTATRLKDENAQKLQRIRSS